MASHIEKDDDRPVASGTKQILATTFGAALLVIGSAIVSTLATKGWRWGIGMLGVLFVIEGIDSLYVGITGKNGAAPILLSWWPLM